jgi:hypothetical protein
MNPEATTKQPTESILQRIRKLAAMTTSSNPNEAAVAAAKMQALLLEYNLTLEQVGGSRSAADYVRQDLPVQAAAWRQIIMGALARNNFCKAIILKGGKMGVVGQPHNIEVVEWMYGYVAEQIDRLCEVWAEAEALALGNAVSRADRNAFRVGAAVTIQQRLDAERKQAQAGSGQVQALVVKRDHEAEVAFRKHWPNTRSVGGTRVSGNGMEAGKAAGHKVAFRQPVQGGSSGPRAIGGGR